MKNKEIREKTARTDYSHSSHTRSSRLGFPEGCREWGISSFVAAGLPLPEHSQTILIQELLQNTWEGELWDVEGKHLMV